MANHVLALSNGIRPYPWIPSGEHELRPLFRKAVDAVLSIVASSNPSSLQHFRWKVISCRERSGKAF